MTNIIIDSLPTTVEVDGREYDIASDFRTSILFELMIQDNDLPDGEKVKLAADLYFGDKKPNDLEEAMNRIIWFYSCGRSEEKESGKQSGGRRAFTRRIYDYEEDANYIYSAFLGQYGIDLQDIEYLHWWKFQALFAGLNEDQRISKIMSYRSVDIAKIKNRSEREHYREMQEKYRLPDKRSKRQKQNDVGAFFGVFAP